MRKGIELPMNTLVVVSIAVLILMAMIAFFMSGFKNPSSSQTKYNKVLSECQKWVANGCEGDVPDSLGKAYCEWKGEGKWDSNKKSCGSGSDITSDIKSVCQCS